ncbi:MAG TPA: hypothetical protein VF693_11580 [Allosphingosinicella sp.]|jgi:hypothetical protein
MDRSKNLFSPKPIFIGFGLSSLYGLFSAIFLSCSGSVDLNQYLLAYFVTFNSAISGGLVFATALTVWRTQDYIPNIVEGTFSETVLNETQYSAHRSAFSSTWLTIRFSCFFALIAAMVFYNTGFPFSEIPDLSLVFIGCLQYVAGVYVGRKIFHIGHMIRCLSRADVDPKMFTEDRLAGISSYVTYISILTAVAVYVGVISYYRAPFAYDGIGGLAMRSLMLLPAIIAVPVLIFAYSPRVVVRRLYERAVDAMLMKLREKAKNDDLTEFESEARIIELRKTLYDELNSRLKTTLEDVPMVIVLGVALLSVVKI